MIKNIDGTSATHKKTVGGTNDYVTAFAVSVITTDSKEAPIHWDEMGEVKKITRAASNGSKPLPLYTTAVVSPISISARMKMEIHITYYNYGINGKYRLQ